jgi:hypothetical protein
MHPLVLVLEISFDVLQQIPFYVIRNDPDSRRSRKVLQLYERSPHLACISLTVLKYYVQLSSFYSPYAEYFKESKSESATMDMDGSRQMLQIGCYFIYGVAVSTVLLR